MAHINFVMDDEDYLLVKQQADKNATSLSEVIRLLIKKGLVLDYPEKSKQIHLNCAVESLLLLRKLAEFRDHQIVIDANMEAKELVHSLFVESASK